VNKTATSAAQLAKSAFCFILIRVQLLFPAAREQTKTSYSFLTSWHNSIFDYKLRTD